MHRIDAVRFGLAGGVVMAALCFVMTLLAVLNGYGAAFLQQFEGLFIGYDISITGSLVGLAYGFLCGFIELFFIAFIYNLLLGPDIRGQDQSRSTPTGQ